MIRRLVSALSAAALLASAAILAAVPPAQAQSGVTLRDSTGIGYDDSRGLPVRAAGFNSRTVATAAYTLPANTTFALGQLVGNSATAGSVTPITFNACRVAGGSGFVTAAKLSTSNTSTTNASFRLHLYRNSPVSSVGNGGAYLTTSAVWLGDIDITVGHAFSDEAAGIGIVVEPANSPIIYDCAAGSQAIYGLLEARAAYSGLSAQTFMATLYNWQN